MNEPHLPLRLLQQHGGNRAAATHALHEQQGAKSDRRAAKFATLRAQDDAKRALEWERELARRQRRSDEAVDRRRAAVRIQSIWRGWLACERIAEEERVRAYANRAVPLPAPPPDAARRPRRRTLAQTRSHTEQVLSGRVVQRGVRTWLARKSAEENGRRRRQEAAAGAARARVLAAAARRRQVQEARRDALAAVERRKLELTSTLRIQSAFRGHLQRRLFQWLYVGATDVY